MERDGDTIRVHYSAAATTGGRVEMTECFSPFVVGPNVGVTYWVEYEADEEVNWATYNWLRFGDSKEKTIEGAVSILPAHHRFGSMFTYFTWHDDPFEQIASYMALNNTCGFASLALPTSKLAVTIVSEQAANVCEDFRLSNSSSQRPWMKIEEDGEASGGQHVVSGALSRVEFPLHIPREAAPHPASASTWRAQRIRPTGTERVA